MKKYSSTNFPFSHVLGILFLMCSLYYFYFSYIFINQSSPFFTKLLFVNYIIQSFIYVSICKYRKQLNLKILIPYFFISSIVLVFAPVVLTSDIYRYLWEGEVLRNGLSPYVYSPDSVELEFLKDLKFYIWEGVNHKHLSAIYPPFSELLLKVFGRSEVAWKLFIFFCNALSLYFLSLLLKLKKIDQANMVFLAFLPIFLIETLWSGHLEALLVLLSIIFCYLFEKLKDEQNKILLTLLGLIAALSFSIKYVALLPIAIFFIAFFVLQKRKFALREASIVLISFSLFTALLFYPFLDLTADSNLAIFSSLKTYLSHWRFNDSMLHFLGFILEADWEKLETFSWIKNSLLVLFMLSTAYLIKRNRNPYKVSALAFGAYLLCSSTVHPWYVLWFACFFPVYRSNWLIMFALLAPLSYFSLLFGEGNLPYYVKLLEYLPVYILLIGKSSNFTSSKKSPAITIFF